LPSITTRTGGVRTIVKDGISGMTFDLSALPDEYAVYITRLFANSGEYEELALSAFQDYKTRLNWDVAGRTILNLLNEL
jgi:glycosyltransferase involved in cell wall biosynthesis